MNLIIGRLYESTRSFHFTHSANTMLNRLTPYDWFKAIVFAICTFGISQWSFATTEPGEPETLLAEIGLSSLKIIDDVSAAEVRGLAAGSSGTSILIGALIDPSTGSTTNIFQIQSSGASGASVFRSNSINVDFGWTINGIFQRIQAEIGGFGAGFAR
jgi:hypothetical protein